MKTLYKLSNFLIPIIKKNILLVTFLSIMGVMLLLSLGKTEFKFNINANKAIIWHLALTIFFTIGYLSVRTKKKIENTTQEFICTISNKYFYISLAIASLGLVTAILTISAIIPIKDYLQILLYTENNFTAIRNIKIESSTSGLSGIFKVLNYSPLGVFFVNSGFLLFLKFSKKDKKKLLIITIYALLCSIIKIFFSLDRLTILGIFIVLVYSLLYINRKLKLIFLAFMLLVIFLLSYITSIKMQNMGILEFLSLYCKLGFSNFELLLENYDNWSFGFNTFLMPIYFISDFFNNPIIVPKSENVLWDNAQYFYGYLYMDFGIYSFILILFLGWIVGKFQKLINAKKETAVSFFFVVLFTISTFAVVPIIRGVEFWLMIIIGIISSYLFNENNKIINENTF